MYAPVSALLAMACAITICQAVSSPGVIFQDIGHVEAGGMHNIQLEYAEPVNGDLSVQYGSCDELALSNTHHVCGSTHVGDHGLAKRHFNHLNQRPTRSVWLPPSDTPSGGCLRAVSNRTVIGMSSPVTMTRRRERRWTAAADVMDAEGPWFDGVVYLKEKEPEATFVAAAKSKSVGIIGGGMSGLMTSLLLDSVGIHDWEIVEGSNRLGGRVHTVHMDDSKPSDYQYAEMRAMRFPVSVTYPDTNETLTVHDSQLVLQLIDELNKMNGNKSDHTIKLIKWIQTSPNTPGDTLSRRPDGTIPSQTEIDSNPAYQDNVNAWYPDPAKVAQAQADLDDWVAYRKKARQFADNIYKAHQQAVQDGYFDFSEAGYLNYVEKYDKNITDQVVSWVNDYPVFDYEDFYFDATEWKTINQGLSNLPRAFEPHVKNRTLFNHFVSGMSWDAKREKISVQYRYANSLLSMTPPSLDFDYAVVSVPFSRVRLWRLPPFSGLLTRAINNLNYLQICKVALLYKTRFWEHLEQPIYGGCGNVEIPGIEGFCYPPYNINSTGPGVLLASYVTDEEMARAVGAMTESEHIAFVQRAMIETHRSVAAEQWTGQGVRKCWEADEFAAGGWANPLVGQQDLYLPAYFRTEMHTVFVGEHTSYTHAWIWSALSSAVRGTTQLLLDMGLVDEAKHITEFWMARWIHM